MAIKFTKENKAVKARTSKPGKWCTVTLVIQIILTLGLGCLAFGPLLFSGLGVIMYVFIALGCVAVSMFTLFLAFLSPGYRNWWKNAFDFAGKLMNGAKDAFVTMKPYMTWIPVVILVLSSCGFIYNLIYFKKHEKANKGRFIASCVFLGLCVVNMIIAIVMYQNFKFK